MEVWGLRLRILTVSTEKSAVIFLLYANSSITCPGAPELCQGSAFSSILFLILMEPWMNSKVCAKLKAQSSYAPKLGKCGLD